MKTKFPVVPHAGTWIEISLYFDAANPVAVVPHAGTWIEIPISADLGIYLRVVPHAGTWIEIERSENIYNLSISRSPRGNVD